MVGTANLNTNEPSDAAVVRVKDTIKALLLQQIVTAGMYLLILILAV